MPESAMPPTATAVRPTAAAGIANPVAGVMPRRWARGFERGRDFVLARPRAGARLVLGAVAVAAI
jgi:hypothetical protein